LLIVLLLFSGCDDAEPASAPAAPAIAPEPPPVETEEEPADEPVRVAAGAPIVPPTTAQVGGDCSTSDLVGLGDAAPNTFVRVAAGPAGALVAWQSPDGIRVRALDPDGRPRGPSRSVAIEGPLVGLERVGRRFVAVTGAGAVRALGDDGAPVGEPHTIPGVRRGHTVSHGGEHREEGWRAMDVLSHEDRVALAYAFDGSSGGAVELRIAQLSAQDTFSTAPHAFVSLAAGALRGWESTDQGGFALIVGGDAGEGPMRWIALPGEEPSRVRDLPGAVRRFALYEGALRFLVDRRSRGHWMVTIDRSGHAVGEAVPLPEGDPLPEPWGDDVYTRLWAQGGQADFLRRDAALRPIREPVAIGSVPEAGHGEIVWSGEAFLVAWPDASDAVQLRAVVCSPPD
jgi:hypothetical protein